MTTSRLRALMAEQDELDQHDCQEDSEGIIGARFDLEHGRDAAAQLQASRANQKEDRGGVGRAHHGAEQHAFEPGEPEHQAGEGAGEASGDDDSHRREEARR